MTLETTEAIARNSQVYTWEAPDRVIAARYGVDPASIMRFDMNTSPTAPGFVVDELQGPFDPTLNEYPDSTYAGLAEAAAGYVGARPDEILVGCGADEVLDIIGKTFLPPGGTAVLPIPTYSMYGVLSGQRGATLRTVPRLGPEDGYALDVPAMLEAVPSADVVWLCSPNNPTGTADTLAATTAVLEAAASGPDGGPAVVVDEAYIEFHPESVVALRERFPSLIVVRTVSKAFGLPGIRVGYAVSSRRTIERLERLRPPGSISTISAKVARAALRQPEVAARNATIIAAERDRLVERLSDLGLVPRPSVTNFVLTRIGTQEEAESATDHLLRNGLVPRTFGPANPLRGHLRFTVRTPEQDERLLAVIAQWQDGRSA